MDHPMLERLVEALRPVEGLAAIALGGSRGRGTAGPTSDYDIGLYYRPDRPLDVVSLRRAIAPLVDDPDPAVTKIGEWGPWIVGGGWLTVEGQEVDLLYRDLEAVGRVIDDARQGRFTMHYQVGHPHGFCSAIWMGEVATCRVLHDPYGALARLKDRTRYFSIPYRDAIIASFGWEADFAIDNARLAVRRGERNHVAGCAYRALSCLAQVLFALNGRYLINEKGALDEAASFPVTVEGLSGRAAYIWKQIGDGELEGALDGLRDLLTGMNALLPPT
jgi:predicted nucleotidyltransferase